ncbi:hypothetical protein O6H91_Y146700 [Diphasiastrum complanatum]|nr:hypothetical protein O6H91_Y146700 [Diphasiastrum complanatum]
MDSSSLSQRPSFPYQIAAITYSSSRSHLKTESNLKYPVVVHSARKQPHWANDCQDLTSVRLEKTESGHASKATSLPDVGSDSAAPSHRIIRSTAQVQSAECNLDVLCQKGSFREILDTLDLMDHQGISASSRVYARILQRCRTLSDAKRVQTHIARSRLELDNYVGSGIVDMFVKCGSLPDAQVAFNRLPQRNEFAWTSLMFGYANAKKGEEALRTYCQMKVEGVRPSKYTLVAILKACSSLLDLKHGRQIHAEIVKRGYESDKIVGTSLLDMYTKSGSMVDAQSVFARIPHPDVVSWTSLILGYAQQEQGDVALQLYSEMKDKGIVPNDRTFVAVLKACGSLATAENGALVGGKFVKLESLKKGNGIHLQILELGFESDIFVGTTLVDMYAKCGDIVNARRVFENLPKRDVVSWNALILGYAEQEEGEEALTLYARMLNEEVVPDDRTFAAVLKACGVVATMEEEHVIGGKSIKKKSLEKGRLIHSRILEMGFDSKVVVGTSLVDMYTKCGSMVDAHRVFDHLPYRDVVSWTALISGYAEQEESELALKYFWQMQEEGIMPDVETFCSIFKACGKIGALKAGKEIHAEMIRRGLQSKVLETSLILMYGRCGSMVDAHAVFDKVSEKDVQIWSALIGGYARNGQSELALHYFETMENSGLTPEGVTYMCVLSACSHAGLVEKGLMYFELMTKHHRIIPTVQHYGCKVDLLGRAGRLHEAEEVLLGMPMVPDLTMWITLLAACRKFGNVEIGRRTFDAARRQSPQTAALYVAMSNIYAAANMWDKVEEIRKMRIDGRIHKVPGRSWIEVDGKVHAFLVDDKSHPKTMEIYAELKRLIVQIKDEGYVPHLESVLHEKDDKSKEVALWGHSEKLAIAFGLISTPSTEPILVMKNLRVCTDCHNASAIISKITARRISVRDSNRFHHFVDGKCSCGGYW